jgi:hypothetical protein
MDTEFQFTICIRINVFNMLRENSCLLITEECVLAKRTRLNKKFGKVVHNCDPSYSGGGSRRIASSRPAQTMVS